MDEWGEVEGRWGGGELGGERRGGEGRREYHRILLFVVMEKGGYRATCCGIFFLVLYSICIP